MWSPDGLGRTELEIGQLEQPLPFGVGAPFMEVVSMKSAVIYARQSFTQEEQSTSIEVQLEACREWCRKQGVEVVGEYEDANVSSENYPDCESGREACRIDAGWQSWKRQQLTKGRSDYKQGLGQAFDRIEQGGIDYLVVYTRNRLGRTADHSYLDRYLDSFLIRHKCSLVTVQSGTVMDFSDQFMTLLMSLKDSLDYESLKEKRLASMASVNKRINSYTKWSNAFGVMMVDGEVRFDPNCASVVRYVFECVASGASYASILDELNTEYRDMAKGKQWYMTSIRAMLSNLTYCGYMVNRDGVLDRAVNIPEPVISYSLFQKANEVSLAKKGNAGKHHVKGQPAKHFLPLSGYLKCPCGRRMTLYVDRGKTAYHCINDKSHRCTIYVNDDVLRTIQQTFILSVIDSRRRLEESRAMSSRVDGLKASLERFQGALRAKFRLVQTDEDAELYKPEIDEVKKSIAEVKQELAVAQTITEDAQRELHEHMESDFHHIMERELLDHDDYMRLMADTISELVVHDDRLDVVTKHGVTIPIPRIEGQHHSRRLMKCQVLCDSTGDEITDIIHYNLHYYDGEELPTDLLDGGRTVFSNEDVDVIIH